MACVDLTQNGTNWNESDWQTFLFDEFGKNRTNETMGYECFTPCDFNPCKNETECMGNFNSNVTVPGFSVLVPYIKIDLRKKITANIQVNNFKR